MTAARGEWSRFRRYHRPLSMLSIDIDHFKSINDRFGHDVGDRALAHVASLCKASRRTSDIVARVGGEEFAILMPETRIEHALMVGERIRAEIAESRCEVRGQQVALTVSLGAAEAKAGMPGFHALMKLADEALYGAKETGRNRVEVARGDPETDRIAAE